MSPPQPPTHYDVLNLTPSIVDDSPDAAKLVKKAYHRALLRNHPDKRGSHTNTSPRAPRAPTVSVDQVTAAFAVLSCPVRRAEYDTKLRQARALSGSAGPDSGHGFQTGVESVDLDDLPYDETKERWHRPCRCGNARGYLFGEEDLAEAEDEGELMVGCQDCSLWLRVHFAVVGDDAP
ncbi:Diphthamide biosynthesis protein 4 [Metarhizium album ARSEF 1941]|uniref:Diphthamide biosynthesis protein 4 n=1 Tax=Metarhizium album (strain ARSEF 1941) TaxID=1081103 RepID=A0A0B2WQJ7_METAS|nr:Diphthamide biosynthesis protein 4 [Metarhizium album ARSEF 1941]KHN96283.1 Diphthamide biosynthesis protein 4 [Metarhizium album ARSEF 1941]